MKKSAVLFLTTFFCVTLYSCGDKKNNELDNETEKISKALQDNDKISIRSSKSYRGNLIDALYYEEVEKNAALKQLENELEAFREGSEKGLEKDKDLEKYDHYNNKSEEYYDAAIHNAIRLKDSLLRKKIADLMIAHKNRYKSKTAGLNALLDTINKNRTTLEDQHEVLKIMITLPIITEYQNNSIPSDSAFQKKIRKQKSLIQKIQTATPKY